MSVLAQNPYRPNTLNFKALFVDYESPAESSFGNLRNYKNGLEVSYNRNILDYLNLSVPLRAGVVKYVGELNNDVFVSLGGQLQLQYWKESQSIIPYALTGAHAVYEDVSGDFNFEIPVGIGVDFKMGQNSYFNIQLEYHLGLADDRDNLQHGLGFKYLIGKEVEKEKVPLKPVDFDEDGVPDETDECPDVPGLIELNGCPDTDGDGIADADDQCPDFAGRIEMGGCPDTDGDGISDNEDQCPSLVGPIENKGCPVLDKDNDGILDAEDECPDEAGTRATQGCPDTDGDGIADRSDQCPNDAGLTRFNGCPDRDGDGIHDALDLCPGTFGSPDNDGCPVVKREVKELLDFAQRAIQFDVAQSTLKSESIPVLNQILDIMRRNPEYGLSISGHTDSQGEPFNNLDLSERRAKACYDFLVERGIADDRVSYVGYGETRPIATNDTEAGKRLNRRVEFEIRFK